MFLVTWSMMTEFWADGMQDCMSSTNSSIGSCGTSPYFTPPNNNPAETTPQWV